MNSATAVYLRGRLVLLVLYFHVINIALCRDGKGLKIEMFYEVMTSS